MSSDFEEAISDSKDVAERDVATQLTVSKPAAAKKAVHWDYLATSLLLG